MNSPTWMGVSLSPLPRPPALAARRRTLDRTVERRLRVWIRSALQLPSFSSIVMSEWVAMDSRCVPHTLSVTVRTGSNVCHFTIEQASERITESAVRAVLSKHVSALVQEMNIHDPS